MPVSSVPSVIEPTSAPVVRSTVPASPGSSSAASAIRRAVGADGHGAGGASPVRKNLTASEIVVASCVSSSWPMNCRCATCAKSEVSRLLPVRQFSTSADCLITVPSPDAK